jgi:hypothetical protein
MPNYELFIRAIVSEAREVSDGVFQEDVERGFWQCSRTVELPFRPRNGDVIFLQNPPRQDDERFIDDPMDSGTEVSLRSVMWDVENARFLCHGDWNVGFQHEQSVETLQDLYPGWQFLWVGQGMIDDDSLRILKEEPT